TAQITTLTVKLQGTNFTAPPVTISNSTQYSLNNGSAAFPVVKNDQTNILIMANVGNCAPSFEDHMASFQLLPTTQPLQGGPIVQQGTWKTTVICPSVFTNGRRYW